MPNWHADPGLVFEDDSMTEQDLDRVMEIETASFPTPWTRASFLAEIAHPRVAWNPVVRVDGRLVAYACVWFAGGEAQINNVAVEPGWRGRGCGRRLVERVLSEARRRGCREATLEVRPSNEAARSLYGSFGFRETGRRRGYYQDTGEDALLMALPLAEP